jgi:hypothetical protein
MEEDVKLLARHFRLVYVRRTHWTLAPIRIRVKLLNGEKLHRTYAHGSQEERWKKVGGVFLSSLNNAPQFPFDVIYFQECPRNVELFDRFGQNARICGVVYQPPTWRLHEEAIAFRFAEKPPHLKQMAFDGLTRMRNLMEAAPMLTPAAVGRLRHGLLLPKSQPWSAPLPSEPVARARDTTERVP